MIDDLKKAFAILFLAALWKIGIYEGNCTTALMASPFLIAYIIESKNKKPSKHSKTERTEGFCKK